MAEVVLEPLVVLELLLEEVLWEASPLPHLVEPKRKMEESRKQILRVGEGGDNDEVRDSENVMLDSSVRGIVS